MNRTYVFLSIGVILILTIGISIIWTLTSKNTSNSLFLGYYDKTGKVAITAPPFAIRTRPFKEGLAGIRLSNTSIGYINTHGQLVFRLDTDVPDPPDGPGVQDFSEGLVPFQQNKLWGYVDKTGKIVIKPKYDDAMSFKEGLAPVKLGGYWGYVDTNNKTVIERQFQNAMPFSEGLAAVMNREKKIGYIDKTGNWVVPAHFEVAGRFSQQRAWVDDGRYIDPTGKVVIDLYAANYPGVERGPLLDEDQRTKQRHENILQFYLNECSLFDVREKVLTDPRKAAWHRWLESTEFHEGLAVVSAGSIKRFINKAGQYLVRQIGGDGHGHPIVSANFQGAHGFSDGIACVRLEDRYRYIKPNGDFVTPNDYAEASDFSDDMARVSFAGDYAFIDKKGNVAFKVKKDQGLKFSEGFSQVTDRAP